MIQAGHTGRALTFFLFFLMSLILTGHACAGETVRILVMDGLPRLNLHFPPDFDVQDKTGMGMVTEEEGGEGAVLVMDKDNGPAEGVRVFAGGTVININGFALTGVIEVKRGKGGLFRIINELDLEDYTRAVVGEEMSQHWPIEVLKAQAVVARTYSLYRKSKAASPDYDLCATVNSQMFTGGAGEKEGPALAAEETKGEVLTYGGELVETLYHSTCGGITEDAGEVWDWSLPYLKPRGCDCRKESPYGSWEKTLSESEIEDDLSRNGYRTTGITSIKVTDRSDTGRAKKVLVKAAYGGATLTGAEFRRILGYSKLPSTCFTLKREGNSYVFSGRGSGHGVGLCQWGAKVMAGEGRDYREILAHYYPGTTLSTVTPGEGR